MSRLCFACGSLRATARCQPPAPAERWFMLQATPGSHEDIHLWAHSLTHSHRAGFGGGWGNVFCVESTAYADDSDTQMTQNDCCFQRQKSPGQVSTRPPLYLGMICKGTGVGFPTWGHCLLRTREVPSTWWLPAIRFLSLFLLFSV